MRRRLLIFILFVLPSTFATAAEPSTAPSGQPGVPASNGVVKDGVSILATLTRQTISGDEQPQLTIQFTNVGTDYINLYDVEAYWNWHFEFINTDPKAAQQGAAWALRMAGIPFRKPIAHRQIKVGETTQVAINLNDPPFTFDFVYAGQVDHLIAPVRRLPTGTYQVSVTPTLQNPFGPGYHEWVGPLTTTAGKLTVRQLASNEKTEPTPRELAAFDDAINRVTEKLQGNGLWLNGGFPQIKLPKGAKLEDVIDAAVNQSSLESKAYQILKVNRFSRGGMPQAVSGSAALVRVGKTLKVVIIFPFGESGWWSRFHDAELRSPLTQPAPASQ